MNYSRLTSDEFAQIMQTSNYGERYNELIARAIRTNGHAKNVTPCNKRRGFEIHHVIPRSFGGTNVESNLVYLTPYEHILAHYYLYLGTMNAHMLLAFRLMIDMDFQKLTMDEQADLEVLSYWGKVREECRQRIMTDEGRTTISKRAKERWQRLRESGRIDEVRANISKTTADGMANSKKAQIRTRVNLGCKKFWNPETGEARNWYPGMPEFKLPWIPGRPKMKQSSKDKLSATLKNTPHHWYYNDELKQNRTFKENETVPNGWYPGIKKEYHGNYAKVKRNNKVKKLNELINNE